VSKKLEPRAIRRWVALEILPALVVFAVVAAIVRVISHGFDLRLWLELAFFYVVFTAAVAAVRHLRADRAR
jgi:hypothetical protein